MEVTKALEHFRNKQGHNYNCAQAIAAAFDADPAHFSAHGSGRAPEGWCGAAYAAAELSRDTEAVKAVFMEAAGSVACREIRRSRAMSCAACVETSARLVQQSRNATKS
jgi:hypothetical protein